MSANAKQTQKLMKDILQEQDYSLQLALKNCLPQVASQMFAKNLIPESVKDEPTYDKLVGEFKAGMEFKDASELQNHWETFIEILSNQGGSAIGAAKYLAKELTEKLKSHNAPRTDVQLQGIIALIISLFYHDHSVALSTPQETVNYFVLENDEIETTLESLHKDFTNLMVEVQSALDEKLINNKIKMVDFSRWIYHHLLKRVRDINECKNLDSIFEKLEPSFDFLQCKLIVDMSERFLNDVYFGDGEDKNSLVSKLKEHMDKADTFSRSTTVKQLKDQLETIYLPYLSNLSNMPQIQIRFHAQSLWNGVLFEMLRLLIGHLLPDVSKQSILQHIEIISGSIIIKYNIDESNAAHLVAYVQGKLQFMRLIGIFGLTINTVIRTQKLVGETCLLRETITNGESILKDEENTTFNFDTALFEAAKIGHIEAAQFLMKIGANIDVAINEAGKVHQNEIAQFLFEWGDISTMLGKFSYYTYTLYN